jgi:soluble lytic murein transglycosylase-like protein
MTKRTLVDSLTIRMAKARRKQQSSKFLRLLGGRGAATLVLGAALSLGGFTEAVDGVHFLVEKDLDAVRVVKQKGDDEKVVAKLQDGFAANSVFKLSQIFPDSLVSRERSMFDTAWLPVDRSTPAASPAAKRDLFHEEMARINHAIRRQFFEDTMPYGELIHEKALKYDVDPALVAAVIEQESRFRERARSQVGARGLMQLMPRTGRWMGARDLYDPEQNVDAGVKYIKYLQKRFNGNVKQTIAAYNAGEGNVKRYGGVPPFRETQTYVKKVMRNYEKRNQELQKYAGSAADTPDGTLTLR